MNNIKYLSLFFAVINAANPTDFFSNISSKLSEDEKNHLTEIQKIFKKQEETISKLSKQSNEKTTKNGELLQQIKESKKENRLLNEVMKKNADIFSHCKQPDVELTAENVMLKSENKRIKEENTELKKKPFLPKTCTGWATLTLVVVGTFVIANIYRTLYCS